jgi:hypothetical protein
MLLPELVRLIDNRQHFGALKQFHAAGLARAAERGKVVGDADDPDQGAVAAYDRNA